MLEAPLCSCHGEPKRWHTRPRGGSWECRVEHRLSERRRYEANPEPRLSYQRAYYLANRERELARKRDEYQSRAALLERFKTLKGCARCGYREHPAALQFHHRDPATKAGKVSSFLRAGMAKVREEISKCDVLCANCHAITHSEMAA